MRKILALMNASLLLGYPAHAARPVANPRTQTTDIGARMAVPGNTPLAPLGSGQLTSPAASIRTDDPAQSGPHINFRADNPTAVEADTELSLPTATTLPLSQGDSRLNAVGVGEVEPESPGEVVVTKDGSHGEQNPAAKSRRQPRTAKGQLDQAGTGDEVTASLMDGKKPGKAGSEAPPVAVDAAAPKTKTTKSKRSGNRHARVRKDTVQSPMETYLRNIDETPLLTADEEKELAYQIAEGDAEARDHMVRANLRLVVNIARSYRGRGLGLQDLIEEGNLGLMRAVEGFDPTMGTRFSTYASYWIKQSIKRGLVNTAKTVRLPAYMVELLSKWRRAETVLHDELGRPPTEEEIAAKLGLPKKKLNIIRKAIRVYGQTPANTSQLGHDGVSLESLLQDPGKGPPDTLVANEEVDFVLGLLDQLEPREAQVLRWRFGIDGDGPFTLEEIGRRLNLTRERVRQIEQETLKKLQTRTSLEGDNNLDGGDSE